MNLFFPYHPWDNCIFYLHEKPIFYRSKTTIHVAKYTSQVPWMVRDLTNFAKEMMDWNSCLTIGLGEGVGVALRRSGVLEGPGSGGRLSACLGALECLIPGDGFNMGVSKNSGFSPQIIHLHRDFHDFHHPFWGFPPIFGNTHRFFDFHPKIGEMIQFDEPIFQTQRGKRHS